jgi:predicted thioesterase
MNPLQNIEVGMTMEISVVVAPEDTVGHLVPGMPMVFATPMMILLMERAATAAIAPHLPEGYVSLGIAVNIRHLVATMVGRTVRATARVTDVRGRSVGFDVEAWDGTRKIGDGTHRRGVVQAAEFEQRLTRR